MARQITAIVVGPIDVAVDIVNGHTARSLGGGVLRQTDRPVADQRTVEFDPPQIVGVYVHPVKLAVVLRGIAGRRRNRADRRPAQRVLVHREALVIYNRVSGDGNSGGDGGDRLGAGIVFGDHSEGIQGAVGARGRGPVSAIGGVDGVVAADRKGGGGAGAGTYLERAAGDRFDDEGVDRSVGIGLIALKSEVAEGYGNFAVLVAGGRRPAKTAESGRCICGHMDL